MGERNPLFGIRKLSANDLAKLRVGAFEEFPGIQAAWTEELQEAEGTQNFLNAVQNYPLLKGVQTNLYKCFLPQAWRLMAHRGVAAILHPEGPYDATVDACYRHDGAGLPGGIKNDDGEWDISGHLDRIVKIDTQTLATFARLFDESDTPGKRARLPVLHSRPDVRLR